MASLPIEIPHTCVKHPAYQCSKCCDCECCSRTVKDEHKGQENGVKNDIFLKTDRFKFWKDKLSDSSLTPRTMFKGPTSYTSMKDEFDAMVTMYEILDDNAVKPISYTDIEPWKENQREAYNLPENSMKGEYWMEKINGLSLQHIMNILQRKIGKLQPGETSKNPERQVRDKEKLVNIRTQIQTVKDKLGKTDFEQIGRAHV